MGISSKAFERELTNKIKKLDRLRDRIRRIWRGNPTTSVQDGEFLEKLTKLNSKQEVLTFILNALDRASSIPPIEAPSQEEKTALENIVAALESKKTKFENARRALIFVSNLLTAAETLTAEARARFDTATSGTT
jgi:hypothetical protein